MHRHGYKGRKFGRERDQRRALLKGLADALVLHESIETTWPKAKETARYTEKLVTKAKKGGLHNRRQVISGLQTLEAANKLVDEMAPKIERTSGFLRVVRTTTRSGDGALLARVSFVDEFKKAVPAKKSDAEAEEKKPAEKKTEAKAAPRAAATKDSARKTAASKAPVQAKRTGVRGNR